MRLFKAHATFVLRHFCFCFTTRFLIELMDDSSQLPTHYLRAEKLKTLFASQDRTKEWTVIAEFFKDTDCIIFRVR